MRTVRDRIRHTLMFEAIALFFVATVGAWVTGHSMAALGTLGVLFSLLAMAWNFVFNWLFDLWDRKYRGMAPRGAGIRVVHAVLFEAFLIIVGIFVTAWWLSISYLDALLLDLGFSAFFLVYAYVFNWSYDIVFPVPRGDRGEVAP
ncbi:Uncharacterized membrane protein [Shimia gijangensis]|uniref:Uncharacterized membrane protein n=1 Tax=Shimia gijangensis TaxID=1470563 RepID=A0A1M6KA30_9RHOB|nr:PACE efflux transporter [Shimia gijangensis]SHJ55792.1 Uncharacterized membrane protein [Shimia gijangensis]